MNYPSNLVLRPLEGWPHQHTKNRKHSPFSATWGTTMTQLGYELRHLGATVNNPAVLQLAIDEAQFRRDGMPRADARPSHPGVIVNIESKHGSLSYPCDTFYHWQDNLRAITLALEALRRLDRYGITQTGQQYRGWQAIEARPNEAIVESALNLLRIAAEAPSDYDLTAPAAKTKLLRKAQERTHPDRNGGMRTMWDQVEAAKDVLRRAGHL